jgi:hypothetical protein
MRPRLSSALDWLAIGLLGFFLVAAVPQAMQRAWKMLGLVSETRGESEAEARGRAYGKDFTRAIDEIRRAIPEHGGYLLVDGGQPEEGGVYWVRYELAPRRASYLGSLGELTDARRVRKRIGVNLRQVVVSYGPGVPPRLYERFRFVNEIERRAGGAGSPGGAGNHRGAGADASGAPGAPAGHGR